MPTTKLECENCSKLWDEEDISNDDGVCSCGGDLNEVEVMDESEAESLYRDYLNEGEWIEVAGISFAPADVLRNMDLTAYQCGLADYIDSVGLKVEGYF